MAYLLAELAGTRIKPVIYALIFLLIHAGATAYFVLFYDMKITGAIAWTVVFTVMSVLTAYRDITDTVDTTLSRDAVVGVILYGVNYAVGYLLYVGYERAWAGEMMAQLQPIAVFWFLATIWIALLMNVYYLNAVRRLKTPRHVLVSNCAMAAVFTLFVAGIYFIDALRQGMTYLISGFVYLFALFMELMSYLSSGGDTGEGGSSGSVDTGQAGLSGEKHVDTLFDVVFMKAVEILIVILLVAAALFLLWKLFQLFRYLYRRASGFLNTWDSRTVAYVDEKEDLLTAEIFRSEMAERLERLRRRFRPRPKLRDMSDDRARVRALYQWMTEKQLRRGEYTPSDTAEEFLRRIDPGPQGEAFTQSYERARYSDHDPLPGAVEAGEKLYHQSHSGG